AGGRQRHLQRAVGVVVGGDLERRRACPRGLGREPDRQLAALPWRDRPQTAIGAMMKSPGSAPVNDSPATDSSRCPALPSVSVPGWLRVPCGVVANGGGEDGVRCATGTETATPPGTLAPVMKLWFTSVPSTSASPIVPVRLVQ